MTPRFKIEAVKQSVLDYYGIAAFDFNNRKVWSVWPRHVVMYFLRKQGLPYVQIAVEMQRKDHRTAMNAVDAVNFQATHSDALFEDIRKIEEMINERINKRP